MILKQQFIPIGNSSRPGITLKSIESITLHWIGPYLHSPETVRDWWMCDAVQASAHYVVRDKYVLQCIPEQEVAWHCGCSGNYSSIGIEMVPKNIKGLFSDDTIDSVIELCKRLPKVKLLRHYDWTNKDCPRYYTPFVEDGDIRWLELKSVIEKGREEI